VGVEVALGVEETLGVGVALGVEETVAGVDTLGDTLDDTEGAALVVGGTEPDWLGVGVLDGAVTGPGPDRNGPA
jgi:hypothetical protein